MYGTFGHNGSFQKQSTLPPQRKFLPSGGGGEKKLFVIIVSILGHPGLISSVGEVWIFSGMTQCNLMGEWH